MEEMALNVFCAGSGGLLSNSRIKNRGNSDYYCHYEFLTNVDRGVLVCQNAAQGTAIAEFSMNHNTCYESDATLTCTDFTQWSYLCDDVTLTRAYKKTTRFRF